MSRQVYHGPKLSEIKKVFVQLQAWYPHLYPRPYIAQIFFLMFSTL